MTVCSVEKSLPAAFRIADFLNFHERDEESVAERVTDSSLEKGLIWQTHPARICFDFSSQDKVMLTLEVDDYSGVIDESDLLSLANHMLGLDQKVEEFEAWVNTHPSPLASLVQKQLGLRIPQSASPFEAFSWAIIGQQISVRAAVSIRRKFIKSFGLKHSSGLFCYPDILSLKQTAPESLQAIGFSKAKAVALLLLVEQLQSNTLVWPTSIHTDTIKTLEKQLLALKGIGPWTVSYGLLRGFSWLDGSLHGDVAVRRNLSRLLVDDSVLDAKVTECWLADFSPWRALVAAHLWAMSSSAGY